MTSVTVFKYINRGYQGTIVLIPGWATDYRIFATLDLKFNYLMPVDFLPLTFEKGLLRALKENNIEKVSLFGWSLGAFVAQEFASHNTGLVDEIILVSVKRRYEAEGLRAIRGHLEKSKRGYLYKFYTQCFSGNGEMRWFRENLLKPYCNELDLGYLLKSLDYLENSEIRPGLLNNIKRIKILHGERDSIAPIQGAIGIKKNLPRAKFARIKGAGHIPFLKRGFNSYI